MSDDRIRMDTCRIFACQMILSEWTRVGCLLVIWPGVTWGLGDNHWLERNGCHLDMGDTLSPVNGCHPGPGDNHSPVNGCHPGPDDNLVPFIALTMNVMCVSLQALAVFAEA